MGEQRNLTEENVEKFEMCQMCSLLMAILDRVEMATEDPEIIKLTKQRLDIAELMGLKVVFEGKIDSGKMQ